VAKDYKRLPIMKESERYATVRACKYVYEVIEDCPLVATKEFIDK
jgi:glycerol-3-phosphate cytidylyltransferase-like family protein